MFSIFVNKLINTFKGIGIFKIQVDSFRKIYLSIRVIPLIIVKSKLVGTSEKEVLCKLKNLHSD